MNDELSSSEKLQNLIYALSPEAALLDADQTIVSLIDPEVGSFMYIGPFDDILEADLYAQGAVKDIMADLTELSDPITYRLLPLTSPENG